MATFQQLKQNIGHAFDYVAEGHYHVKECAYGLFERAIRLPGAVDSDKAQADYKSGILRIELPKSKITPHKTIKVRIS